MLLSKILLEKSYFKFLYFGVIYILNLIKNHTLNFDNIYIFNLEKKIYTLDFDIIYTTDLKKSYPSF